MKYPAILALGFLILAGRENPSGGIPPGYGAPYEQGNPSVHSPIGGGAGWTGSEDLPQPIVTRQTVFAIPFHLVPAQESSQQAVEVQLYVSTDQGRRWQLYQRVRPTEGQFLVRTTGEGEYWFLVRTVDRAGRVRPQGPPRPEMRVLVDLTPPDLVLAAEPTPSGPVTLRWKMTDQTLRPESLRIAYRIMPDGPWLAVPMEAAQLQPLPQGQEGRLVWNPPVGATRAELRAEVADAAGNLAVAHAQVQVPPSSDPANFLNPPANLVEQSQWRATRREAPSQPLLPEPSFSSGGLQAGESSSFFGLGVQGRLQPAGGTDASNPLASPAPLTNYPPVRREVSGPGHQGPFPAPGGADQGGPNSSSGDSATPGNSLGTGASSSGPSVGSSSASAFPGQAGGGTAPGASSASEQPKPPPSANLPNSPANPSTSSATPPNSPSAKSPPPAAKPSEPSGKQASGAVRSTESSGNPGAAASKPAQNAPPGASPGTTSANPSVKPAPASPTPAASSGKPAPNPSPNQANGAAPQPNSPGSASGSERPVRMINSRIFELEYELGSGTQPGRVELWATRDGGRTWHCWGPDPDARSPMIVSVPEEGIYGFRVLVSSDPRTPTSGPQPGETPDVWIGADWTRPTGRLLAVEPNQTDQYVQLLIRWEATDRYLADRPISLFYSPTGAGGSWTPIAASLENTGQYLWKVPAHVPDRVYIRLEIRDQAGNLSVDQTREPIRLGSGRERAKIREVRPVNPSSKAFLPGRLS